MRGRASISSDDDAEGARAGALRVRRSPSLFFSTRVSVFTPLTSEHLISACEPVVRVATFACRLVGTVQVSPATVIDVDETAVTRPFASLRSLTVFVDWHLPGPVSTAAPPAVPPPSLPS